MTYIIFEVRLEVKYYFYEVVLHQKIFLTVIVDFDIISPLKLSKKLGENPLIELYIIFGFCMLDVQHIFSSWVDEQESRRTVSNG